MLSYHFHAGLNLENFVFVPLSRITLSHVPLKRAEVRRKFCVRTTNTRTTSTRTTNTRGWTYKILRSYHKHAQLDLINFAFIPLPRAPLPRVPLPRAGGHRQFCVRTITTRGWLKKILRSYHYHADNYHARLELRKLCVRTNITRPTTTSV